MGKVANPPVDRNATHRGTSDSSDPISHVVAGLERQIAAIGERMDAAVCDATASLQASVQRLQQHVEATETITPLLDIKDLARTLKVSERTAEKVVASGKLRPLWIKGQRRFHPDAIDAYLRAAARKETKRRGGR